MINVLSKNLFFSQLVNTLFIIISSSHYYYEGGYLALEVMILLGMKS